MAQSLHAESRRLSEAERAAVQEAVMYLNSGPGPLVEHLAYASPLRKLKPTDAAQEIEVRLGPNTGATWELQTVVPALQEQNAAFTISYPSGIDETAMFDLVKENGAFHVSDIRVLGQRSRHQAIFPSSQIPIQAAIPPERSSLAILIAVVAGILAAASAFLRSLHRPTARIAVAVAVVVASGAVALLIRDDNLIKSAEPVAAASLLSPRPADSYPRLGSLLPIRREMTLGNADVRTLSKAGCREGTCADVATLWKAQLDLQQMRTAEAKAALAKFDSPSEIPLVEVLRGRVAVLEGNDTASVIAYENAVNLGPGRDALWYETAQALGSLGFDDRAETYFRKTARMGSRAADVYYMLSLLAASKHKDEDAEKYLAQAWSLQPVERSALLRTAVLNPILHKSDKDNRVSLSDPSEPPVFSPEASSRSIVLPDGSKAQISGNSLRVSMGDQQLFVPGGASLAPVGTPTVDAATASGEDEERALRDYDKLAEVSRSPGVYTNPALRLRILRTAAVLANRNRWADLASLTEGLTPRSENIPPDLFFLRSIALQRLQRKDEAMSILVDLASSKVLQRKRDARALRNLGEMLASMDAFDLAIRMLDRAQAIRPNEFVDERARQIAMSKRLATKYNTYSTDHFEIHFPEDVSQSAAVEMGNIFEAEFTRLQQYVPTPSFQRVVVNIVWWDEFRSTITGSDYILGMYTGKITVPLAGIRMYIPEIVAILSHELCHAMLAQATNDQAPHWFQEGLAQLIEMKDFIPNAFTNYDKNKVFAMTLLDPILTDAGEPAMMSQAYLQSQTTLKYIHMKYGQRGVTAMISAFHDGATTEAAIKKLSGQELPDFDKQLRVWASTAVQVFENGAPVRYDLAPDEGIRWSKPKPQTPRSF
ncbi:MAG: peptidase MA family metallohydrolase [Thermoanaerobaculia bacterium]